MICVVTGDLHLHNYSDTINPKTGMSFKLGRIMEGLTFIAEYAINNNIKFFVIVGDVFHGKDIIHSTAYNLFLDFIRKYDNKLKFVIIDGNHDLSGKNENVVSSLRSLGKETNVVYLPQPKMVEDCLFLPYSTKVKEILLQNKAKFLFSHFGLNEGILNSGISIVSEVKASDLIGRYENVILGHYHKPQDLLDDRIKISYVGSPVQLDWGEKNEDKRFLVVDTEKNEFGSVIVEYSQKYYEFEITSENKNDIVYMTKQLISDGHKVKVIQKEDGDLTSELDTEEVIIVDKTEKDITNRGMSLTSAIKENLIRYLEIKQIPKEKHEKYLKIGVDITGG